MANRPLTKKAWMEFLEKACEEFDWKGAGKREWQGLTDEEIWELAAHCLDRVASRMQFARAIESKLREKNNAR